MRRDVSIVVIANMSVVICAFFSQNLQWSLSFRCKTAQLFRKTTTTKLSMDMFNLNEHV